MTPYRISARPEEKPQHRHNLWMRCVRFVTRALIKFNYWTHTQPIWPFFPLVDRKSKLGYWKRIPSRVPQPPNVGARIQYTNPMPSAKELEPYILKNKTIIWPWRELGLTNEKWTQLLYEKQHAKKKDEDSP